MGQQPPVGRHRPRRPHRHRAPALPAHFATRSRSALSVTALGATLAAGIGVAGASAVSASAAPTGFGPGPHVTAAHPLATYAAEAPASDQAPGKALPAGSRHLEARAAPVAAPVQRKIRPKPVVAVVATAKWVHPLPSAGVTSCFGQRWGRLHAGVDLATAHGTPAVAAGAGLVVAARSSGGYGNAVLIDHGNGYLTHYGHLSTIAVHPGQRVAAGEHIGDEGSTGHSTGPHLHFEVHEGHYGNPVEPTAWMSGHGVKIAGCRPA